VTLDLSCDKTNTLVVGALCGVHCLNTLLQYPVFTEVDLANFASELDESERQVMAAGGVESKDFLKFMAEDSINVGDDGNFSVQVLTKALQARNLECVLLTQSSFFSLVCQNLATENTFVCNKGNHWFTIRKVQNEWYNLNSLNEPQKLSLQDLVSLIDNLLESNKNAIYSIRGEFMETPLNRPTGRDGKWIRVKGSDDLDYQLALKASLQESTTSKPSQQSSGKQFELPHPPPPLPINDLSLPQLMLSMQSYVADCATTMEKFSNRISVLEEKFKLIQQNQNKHLS